jgi:flagellar basal-body rod protein FlgF
MIKGFYTAASGMLAQQVANDNMADNMANVSTVGFKRRSTVYQSFPDMLLNKVQGGENQGQIGSFSPGVNVSSTAIDFSAGGFRQTGNPLDIAIENDGFLAVQLPDGQEVYTRNGSMTLNADGNLSLHTGELVLGEDGNPIQIGTQVSPLTLTAHGEILAGPVGVLGKLKLVQFEDNHQLQKLGNSLYTANGATPKTNGDGTKAATLMQGYLEQPNVNVVWEMIQSITGVRTYEALQKSIQQQNQTLGKAVNEVGRPNG